MGRLAAQANETYRTDLELIANRRLGEGSEEEAMEICWPHRPEDRRKMVHGIIRWICSFASTGTQPEDLGFSSRKIEQDGNGWKTNSCKQLLNELDEIPSYWTAQRGSRITPYALLLEGPALLSGPRLSTMRPAGRTPWPTRVG